MTRGTKLTVLAAVAVIAAYTIIEMRLAPIAPPPPQRYERVRDGIMGTEVRLVVTAPGRSGAGPRALDAAEGELRRVEALMSRRLAGSELSRLNAAPPGKPVPLSPELRGLLGLSRRLAGETEGAFDVTCLPIIRVWAEAGKGRRLPAPADLAKARDLTGWKHFTLTDAGAERLTAGAAIDLGGIAKGYGIDRAIEAARRTGAVGALVDAGGDIRCFGPAPAGPLWRIAVQDPFDTTRTCLVLGVTDLAVLTSGDYRRFTEIEGKHYSHIVDPRTARPVEGAVSVTVVAKEAVIADAWATGLSVLGPAGLALAADRGLEVMMVRGTPERPVVLTTPGFRRLVQSGWPPFPDAVLLTPTTTAAPATGPANPSPSTAFGSEAQARRGEGQG